MGCGLHAHVRRLQERWAFNRQPDFECRAPARLAVHGDAPPVHIDDVLDDFCTQPCAAGLIAHQTIREQMVAYFCSHAIARIRHAQPNAIVPGLVEPVDRDEAVRRHLGDRIIDEIIEQ